MTPKNGLIGKIGNRGNNFRTTVETNLNSYFNELINFTEPFSTRIIIYKTGFTLKLQEMNSYYLSLCYSKRKIYSTFLWDCGCTTEKKSKRKKSMVKLEDILVRTDYEWLSSCQDPLPVCIW